MLLGFKRRFAPFVLDGSKTHTIRATRKIAPKVGEMCHCYVDPRQKTMKLLGRWPCVKVEEIEIEILPPVFLALAGPVVRINGDALSADECEALAFRDGFRDYRFNSHFEEMLKFWKGRLPFKGQIIHWKWSKPSPQASNPRERSEP